MELVAEEIWAAVRASAGTKTPLRFNDVAVLLPSPYGVDVPVSNHVIYLVLKLSI